MKRAFFRIMGFILFTVPTMLMISIPASAETAEDYEKLGESVGPYLLIAIFGFIVLRFCSKKAK